MGRWSVLGDSGQVRRGDCGERVGRVEDENGEEEAIVGEVESVSGGCGQGGAVAEHEREGGG